VEKLAYLTAFSLKTGKSLLEVYANDSECLLLPNLISIDDQTSTAIKEEAIGEVFYDDCSEEDITEAKSFLVPQLP